MNDEIRAWLASAHTASLSTLLDGAPFGSLVPFALHDDAPLLFLSDLAVHTKCLLADPRCSLLVHDPAANDPQTSWRVTLLGRAAQDERPAAKDAFLARHPKTQALPGFAIWRIDVEKTRFIAGFGRMGWIP